MTRALLAGSPAIDGGNPAGCTDPTGGLLTADQRALTRPDSGETRCDIGAFELQDAPTGSPTSTPNPNPQPASCDPLAGTCPPSGLQVVCIDFIIGSCNGVFPSNPMIQTNYLDPLHVFCKDEQTTQPGFAPQGPQIAMNYACDTSVDATAERTGIFANTSTASASKKSRKRHRAAPLVLARAHVVIPPGTDRLVALPLTSAAKKVLGKLRKRHYRGVIKVTLKLSISQPPGARAVTTSKVINMRLGYAAKPKKRSHKH
jgi:hypothetical protein